MDRINRFLRLRPQKKQKSFILRNKIYTVTQKEIKQMRKAQINHCDLISLETKQFYQNYKTKYKFEPVKKSKRIHGESQIRKRVNEKKAYSKKLSNNSKVHDFITRNRDLDMLTSHIWQDLSLLPHEINLNAISNTPLSNENIDTILINRDNKYLNYKHPIKINGILRDKQLIYTFNQKYEIFQNRNYKISEPENIRNELVLLKQNVINHNNGITNQMNTVTSSANKKNLELEYISEFMDLWSLHKFTANLFTHFDSHYFSISNSNIQKRPLFKINEMADQDSKPSSFQYSDHSDVKDFGLQIRNSEIQNFHGHFFTESFNPHFFLTMNNVIYQFTYGNSEIEEIFKLNLRVKSVTFFSLGERLFFSTILVNQMEIWEIKQKKYRTGQMNNHYNTDIQLNQKEHNEEMPQNPSDKQNIMCPKNITNSQKLQSPQNEIFQLKSTNRKIKNTNWRINYLFRYATGADIRSIDMAFSNPEENEDIQNGIDSENERKEHSKEIPLLVACSDITNTIHLNLLYPDGNLHLKKFVFISFPNSLKISAGYIFITGKETIIYKILRQNKNSPFLIKNIGKYHGYSKFVNCDSEKIWGWKNGTMEQIVIYRK